MLQDEEMTEEEKIQYEEQQEERAERLRLYVAAVDAEADRLIAERRDAINDRYSAIIDEQEAKLNEIRRGHTAQQLEKELQQWQDGLQERQMEEMKLRVQDRVEEAVDHSEAQRKCDEHGEAARALIEAEHERQRLTEEGEEGEVDEELAMELRQDTLALQRRVAEMRQKAERLREQVEAKAETQRQDTEALAAFKRARLERFKRNGG